MKMRILTITTAFSLLILTWVSLRTIQNSRDCVNSALVKSLVYFDANGKLEIPSCGRQNTARFWESRQVSDEQRDLLNRLMILERLEGVGLRRVRTPVDLIVTSADPFVVSWDGSQLTIGTSWVRAQGQLERVLVQRWLRDQVGVIGQDIFQQEVLSYLLVGFLSDQLNLEDPWFGDQTDFNSPRNWLSWVSGVGDYCLSSWIALDHLNFCRDFRQIPTHQRELLSTIYDVEKLSLAPLVTSLIWRRYKNSKFADRALFWRGLASGLNDQGVLSRWQWESFVPPHNLPALADWVNTTTEIYWASFGFVETVQHEWVKAELDFVIKGSPEILARPSDLPTLRFFSHDRSVAVLTEGQSWLDGTRRVNLGLNQTRSQIQVLAVCDSMTTHDFARVGAPKLMVVDVCRSTDPIQWKTLIRGGVDEFIQQNSRMVFAALFLPALKQVLDWPTELKFDSANFQALGDILKWKALPWDDRLMAIRPVGVWDAVLAYRL
ncbi:MAG: hypothetical protein IT288_02420 [Bdellovibrionales bacterium]|nr:hypothetical protein [Bdellovibrionales bacterium]